MKKSNIQFRGHCQCCGRLQAVVNRRMSKHGYEVKDRGNNGWFQGVCSGHEFAPVEVERKVLDSVVGSVRRQCSELLELARLFETGVRHPETCRTRRYNHETREYVHAAWAEASSLERAEEVGRQIGILRQRAESGLRMAKFLEGVADTHHGEPLQEVAREEGPEPIHPGDRRVAPSGEVLVAEDIYRGMVHFKDARGFRRKFTTRAWRLLGRAS